MTPLKSPTAYRPTQSDSTKRWLAQHVVVDGVEYPLSIVELLYSEGIWHVNVSRFERETHSTAYHSGVINITTSADPHVKPSVEFLP